MLSVPLSGVSATFTTLSFSELGAMLHEAGGVYEYGHTLLHPLIGFLMGWMWVLGNIVLVPQQAKALDTTCRCSHHGSLTKPRQRFS
ncbi:MAG: hypothetical protein ACUVQY_04745 [Thermoproteota archaeon]